jgi:threonylcarbamoyladenosine tRNA methylthiotransferase MtaB
MKVYLQSLGCKLNQSELESLACQFVQAGHSVVDTVREADLCVLNTCAVTHTAAGKSRQAIRRLRRANSEARLAVTGCYAQMWPQEIRDLRNVDLIVGNEGKEQLVERVEKEWGLKGQGPVSCFPAPDPPGPYSGLCQDPGRLRQSLYLLRR